MKAHRLVLYQVEWQALRVSLLGGWTTPEGTLDNLYRLQEYLAVGDRNEGYSRAWRVLNLLNAVRMGYSGQGLRASVQDTLVCAFREGVTQTHRALRRAGAVFVLPTEEQSRADWQRLDDATQQAIFVNLCHRRRLHADSPRHPCMLLRTPSMASARRRRY